MKEVLRGRDSDGEDRIKIRCNFETNKNNIIVFVSLKNIENSVHQER